MIFNIGEDKKVLEQQMNETVANSRKRKLIPKEKQPQGRPPKQKKKNARLYEQEMFESDGSDDSEIEEVLPLPPPIFIPGQQQRGPQEPSSNQ